MRKEFLLMALVALVLVTSGCMNSTDDSEPEATQIAEDAPPEVEDADVAVMVGEMYFNQAGLMEQNTVQASQGDEIVFYNEGSTDHTVTIEELGINEEIPVGETVTVQADELIEAGYLECTYHGSHEAEITVS